MQGLKGLQPSASYYLATNRAALAGREYGGMDVPYMWHAMDSM